MNEIGTPRDQHATAQATGAPLTSTPDGAAKTVRDHREPGHYWAENEVVDHFLDRIGVYGFAVYTLLTRYVNMTTAQCDPSISKLARQLSVSVPTVQKALKSLEDCGLIDVEPQYNTSKSGKTVQSTNLYTLLAVKGKRPNPVNQVDHVEDTPVNQIYQGGQPDLPPLVNQVSTNNTDLNKNVLNNRSANAAIASSQGESVIEEMDEALDRNPDYQLSKQIKAIHHLDLGEPETEGPCVPGEALDSEGDHSPAPSILRPGAVVTQGARVLGTVNDGGQIVAPPPLPTPEQVTLSINANAPFEVPDGYEAVSFMGEAHLRKPGAKQTVCRARHLHYSAQSRPEWHRHQCQECHDKATQRAAPPPKAPRKERAHDAVFDTLATVYFRLPNLENLTAKTKKWIGINASEVKACQPDGTTTDQLIADLLALPEWYKRHHPNLDLPQVGIKICGYLSDMRADRASKPSNGKPKHDPNCPDCHGEGVVYLSDNTVMVCQGVNHAAA